MHSWSPDLYTFRLHTASHETSSHFSWRFVRSYGRLGVSFYCVLGGKLSSLLVTWPVHVVPYVIARLLMASVTSNLPCKEPTVVSGRISRPNSGPQFSGTETFGSLEDNRSFASASGLSQLKIKIKTPGVTKVQEIESGNLTMTTVIATQYPRDLYLCRATVSV